MKNFLKINIMFVAGISLYACSGGSNAPRSSTSMATTQQVVIPQTIIAPGILSQNQNNSMKIASNPRIRSAEYQLDFPRLNGELPIIENIPGFSQNWLLWSWLANIDKDGNRSYNLTYDPSKIQSEQDLTSIVRFHYRDGSDAYYPIRARLVGNEQKVFAVVDDQPLIANADGTAIQRISFYNNTAEAQKYNFAKTEISPQLGVNDGVDQTLIVNGVKTDTIPAYTAATIDRTVRINKTNVAPGELLPRFLTFNFTGLDTQASNDIALNVYDMIINPSQPYMYAMSNTRWVNSTNQKIQVAIINIGQGAFASDAKVTVDGIANVSITGDNCMQLAVHKMCMKTLDFSKSGNLPPSFDVAIAIDNGNTIKLPFTSTGILLDRTQVDFGAADIGVRKVAAKDYVTNLTGLPINLIAKYNQDDPRFIIDGIDVPNALNPFQTYDMLSAIHYLPFDTSASNAVLYIWDAGLQHILAKLDVAGSGKPATNWDNIMDIDPSYTDYTQDQGIKTYTIDKFGSIYLANGLDKVWRYDNVKWSNLNVDTWPGYKKSNKIAIAVLDDGAVILGGNDGVVQRCFSGACTPYISNIRLIPTALSSIDGATLAAYTDPDDVAKAGMLYLLGTDKSVNLLRSGVSNIGTIGSSIKQKRWFFPADGKLTVFDERGNIVIDDLRNDKLLPDEYVTATYYDDAKSNLYAGTNKGNIYYTQWSQDSARLTWLKIFEAEIDTRSDYVNALYNLPRPVYSITTDVPGRLYWNRGNRKVGYELFYRNSDNAVDQSINLLLQQYGTSIPGLDARLLGYENQYANFGGAVVRFK